MRTTDVYTSHSTNWPAIAVSAALLLPMVAFSRPSGDQPPADARLVPLLVVLVVVVAGVMTATSLRVSIGQGGVIARFGALGVPQFRYPVERIAGAAPATIRPWATPGICWTHADGLRLALRSGPAVGLTLHGGRRVTVAVDHTARALHALQRAGASGVEIHE